MKRFFTSLGLLAVIPFFMSRRSRLFRTAGLRNLKKLAESGRQGGAL